MPVTRNWNPNSKSMMKTKLTLFVAVLAVALFLGGCASVPKPDVPHAVKWNGHWYAFFPDSVSWDDAVKISKERGGHLVFIESKEENQFLAELTHKRTGLSKFTLYVQISSLILSSFCNTYIFLKAIS